MFESLIANIVASNVRNMAVAFAGYLVLHHYMDAAQTNDVIGSIVCLGGAAFSTVKEIMAHRKLQAARAGGPNQTTGA